MISRKRKFPSMLDRAEPIGKYDGVIFGMLCFALLKYQIVYFKFRNAALPPIRGTQHGRTALPDRAPTTA
jgi:hypothetical protein